MSKVVEINKQQTDYNKLLERAKRMHQSGLALMEITHDGFLIRCYSERDAKEVKEDFNKKK